MRPCLLLRVRAAVVGRDCSTRVTCLFDSRGLVLYAPGRESGTYIKKLRRRHMRTSLLFAILVLTLTVAQSGTGVAQGGAPQAGDPANGKAVFAFGNTSCTNCHGLEG